MPPEEVLTSLDRLRLTSLVDFETASRRRLSARASVVRGLCARRLLPIPHPLDFSWWFLDSTLEHLVEEVVIRAPQGTILCLGAPTLYHAVAAVNHGGRLVLWDSDPEIGRRANVYENAEAITKDLTTDHIPQLECAVVVADPPWYADDIRMFLWAARRACRLGGAILVSFPPSGTRPGVSEEWSHIVSWARSLGLRLEKVEPRRLSYLSPPFETNAMLAAGIPMPPLDWRCGDLATFRCEGSTVVERPQARSAEAWEERLLGSVRIRVRLPLSTAPASPSLHRIAKTEILPSVSRRDPRRSLVDVWTSGNRVFQCSERRSLLQILDASGRNVNVERSTRWRLAIPGASHEVEETWKFLKAMVQQEEREIFRWRESCE